MVDKVDICKQKLIRRLRVEYNETKLLVSLCNSFMSLFLTNIFVHGGDATHGAQVMRILKVAAAWTLDTCGKYMPM